MSSAVAYDEMLVRPMMMSMARYFAQFRSRQGDAYQEFLTAVDNVGVRPTFVTLNYDCLLEGALQSQNRTPVYFGSLPNARSRRVLKLHGSCNFFAPRSLIHLSQQSTMRMKDCHVDRLEIVHLDAIVSRCQSGLHEFPIMAQYSPEKPFEIVSTQVDKLKSEYAGFASEAEKIAVIGASFSGPHHDAHFWKPLLDASGELAYVGDCDSAEKLSRHRQVRHFGTAFNQNTKAVAEFLRGART